MNLMNLHESTLIWPSVWAKCARIWWVLPVNGSAKSREKLWSEDVKVANTVKPCQARHVRGHLSKNSGVVSSFSLQKCTDFYTEVATKHWQTMTNDDKLSPNISHHFPIPSGDECVRPSHRPHRPHRPHAPGLHHPSQSPANILVKRKVPSTFEQFELLLINSLSSLIERAVRKHQGIDKVQQHLKTTHWHQSMQLKH